MCKIVMLSKCAAFRSGEKKGNVSLVAPSNACPDTEVAYVGYRIDNDWFIPRRKECKAGMDRIMRLFSLSRQGTGEHVLGRANCSGWSKGSLSVFSGLHAEAATSILRRFVLHHQRNNRRNRSVSRQV